MKSFEASKKSMIKIFEDNKIPINFLNSFIEEQEKKQNEEKKWFSSFQILFSKSIKIRQYSENENIILEIFE
jgi:hypothetical protein